MREQLVFYDNYHSQQGVNSLFSESMSFNYLIILNEVTANWELPTTLLWLFQASARLCNCNYVNKEFAERTPYLYIDLQLLTSRSNSLDHPQAADVLSNMLCWILWKRYSQECDLDCTEFGTHHIYRFFPNVVFLFSIESFISSKATLRLRSHFSLDQ